MIVSSWQLMESRPVFYWGGGVKENPYFLQVFKTLFKDRFVVDDAQFSPKLQLSTLDKFNMDFFNSIFGIS